MPAVDVGRELGGSWRDLVLTDLLYKLVSLVVLAPLMALLVRAFVGMAEGGVLSDTELLVLLLRPMGWVALIAIGGGGLAVAAYAQAGLMTIALGAGADRPIDYRDAVVNTFRRGRFVLELTARIAARSLLLSAPFFAAYGLVYLGLLGAYDINYYLTERPPSFLTAIGLAVVVAGVHAVVLVRLLLGWSLALPIVLFEGVVPALAMRISVERCGRRMWEILRWLVVWGAGVALMETVTSATLHLGGRALVLGDHRTLGAIALRLAVWAALALIVNWLTTLAAAASFAIIVVMLYRATVAADVADAAVARIAGSARWHLPRSIAVGVAVLAALLAVTAAIYVIDDVVVEDRASVTAHRGASAAAPDNTLAAIERAIVDGADWVEIDVQETADGEVVVMHDSDFMKSSANRLKIWEATAADLAELDVGSWFDASFAGERVPTLAQVLESCRDRAGVNIELKYYGHDERLEERVVEIVEALDMADQIVIMSLKRTGVARIRALRPDWTVGLLAAVTVGDLTRIDVDFLAVSTKMASAGFIRRAQASGKEVFVWTVNDALTMSDMLGRGVDSIITDEPALLGRVIAERRDMEPSEHLLLALARFFGAADSEPVQ